MICHIICIMQSNRIICNPITIEKTVLDFPSTNMQWISLFKHQQMWALRHRAQCSETLSTVLWEPEYTGASCSPRAHNLLYVLVSRIVGYNDLCYIYVTSTRSVRNPPGSTRIKPPNRGWAKTKPKLCASTKLFVFSIGLPEIPAYRLQLKKAGGLLSCAYISLFYFLK